MIDRRERRIPIALPVRIWGVDADGITFLRSGWTLDVSRRGVRLDAVDWLHEAGKPIGIQHGKREKQFQVAWLGQSDTPRFGQAGLRGDAVDNHIWGAALPSETSRDPRQQAPPAASSGPLPLLASAWTGDEKRQSMRHRGGGNVLVSLNGSRFPAAGFLLDISLSGCYVEMDTPMPEQSRVNLVISAMESEIRLQGIVRLWHNFMGMGVEFTDVTPEVRTQLERFLSTRRPAN